MLFYKHTLFLVLHLINCYPVTHLFVGTNIHSGSYESETSLNSISSCAWPWQPCSSYLLPELTGRRTGQAASQLVCSYTTLPWWSGCGLEQRHCSCFRSLSLYLDGSPTVTYFWSHFSAGVGASRHILYHIHRNFHRSLILVIAFKHKN